MRKSFVCVLVGLILVVLSAIGCSPKPAPDAVVTYNEMLLNIYSFIGDVSSEFYVNESDRSGVIYFLDRLREMGVNGGGVDISGKMGARGNLDYCVAVNTVDRKIIFLTVLPQSIEIEDEEQRLQFVYLVKGEKIGLLPAKFAMSNDYSWYNNYLDEIYAFYDYCKYLGELGDALDRLGKSIDNFRIMSIFSASQSDINRANVVVAKYNEYIESYNRQIDDLQGELDKYPENIFYVEEYTINPYGVAPIPISPITIPAPFPTVDQLESQMSRIVNLNRGDFKVERVTEKNFVVSGFKIRW